MNSARGERAGCGERRPPPGRVTFYRALRALQVLTLFGAGVLAAPVDAAPAECVVLLHGLARTAASMRPVADALAADYVVVNVDYPSRHAPIAELAAKAIPEGVARCRGLGAGRMHFVTHSLGGILVRYYLARHALPELGRVVMLVPPNAGSELVDRLRDIPGFRAFFGPAWLELGTDMASVPRRVGPANFAVGVIAGTRALSPLSRYLPGASDGTVTVTSMRLPGMTDFLALPVTHTFIMRDATVLAAIRHFLQSGRFPGPLPSP